MQYHYHLGHAAKLGPSSLPKVEPDQRFDPNKEIIENATCTDWRRVLFHILTKKKREQEEQESIADLTAAIEKKTHAVDEIPRKKLIPLSAKYSMIHRKLAHVVKLPKGRLPNWELTARRSHYARDWLVFAEDRSSKPIITGPTRRASISRNTFLKLAQRKKVDVADYIESFTMLCADIPNDLNLVMTRNSLKLLLHGCQLPFPDRFLDKLFSAFSTKNGHIIDMTDYAISMAVLNYGSLDDKLDFAFDIYDIDNDGAISGYDLYNLLQMNIDSILPDDFHIICNGVCKSDIRVTQLLSRERFKTLFKKHSTVPQLVAHLGEVMYHRYYVQLKPKPMLRRRNDEKNTNTTNYTTTNKNGDQHRFSLSKNLSIVNKESNKKTEWVGSRTPVRPATAHPCRNQNSSKHLNTQSTTRLLHDRTESNTTTTTSSSYSYSEMIPKDQFAGLRRKSICSTPDGKIVVIRPQSAMQYSNTPNNKHRTVRSAWK